MDKLKMHSPNLVEQNIEKLAALFPNCVTEAKGEDGSLKQAIDFDLLKQELSRHIVDGPQERYHLNWPGKREALLTANAPIAKTLRPCREESVNFDTTQNLFIEGDNLDALKLLQETYLGKVKMIYIDPPYNTGNDFIYEDDFAEDLDSYIERSNQKDEKGNRLVANTESNGRYHSDWLSMMYSRLKLAKSLLKDDGALFISIDDGESHNLRKILDEIFGVDNFRADVSWQKRYTRSNNTVDFTTVVEHLFVYSRSSSFSVNLLPRTEDADARYTNPDNDKRGVWKGASFLNPATPAQRPNLCYPIKNPTTGSITYPTTNAWRRSQDEFEKLELDGRLYWGKDGLAPVPSIKMFLSEARGLTPINFWAHDYAGNTDQGTAELQALFGAKVFDNPKPVQLIVRCLEHASEQDSIILDFFAGSATTANAVMSKNSQDGGNRKFILVQLPEVCDEKHESSRQGYKTIAEISKKRIQISGEQIIQSKLHENWNKDIGFRVLKVDSSNMSEVYYNPDSVMQSDLFAHVENVKEDRTEEDLLFQVMLDWGVDLTLPIHRETIANKTVFFVAAQQDNTHGALVACFDKDGGIDEAFIKQLAAYNPLRLVFRDAGFASDAAKINVEQLLKQLSPTTDVKTI